MSSRNFAKIPEELLFDTSISPAAVRLYGVIQRYAGKSGNAFPGREELAGRLGASVETVKRSTAELARAGWIERTRRPGSNIWDTRLADGEPTKARVTTDPSPRVTSDPRSPKHGSPQTRARVTTDPSPRVTSDPRSPKHGSPQTRARVTTDPTVGSPVTRLEEREPLNESQLTRVTAAVADAPPTADEIEAEVVHDELPLDIPPTPGPTASPTQVLVGAYVTAIEASGGIATSSQRSAIGRNVKRLIEQDHIELPIILVAIQRAAAKRSRTIDPFLGELQSAWNGSQGSRNAMRTHWYETAAAMDSRKDAAS